MQYKDKDILKAIREGKDHKALEGLYQTLYPKIRKLVNSGDEKEEECKDILQESLLIFYKQVVQNRYDDQYEIAGYIYTVASNLWIKRIKRKNRFVSMESTDEPEILEKSILDEMELKERKVLVQKLFNRLDEKCRQLLTYTIFEELSMKEVAERLGFTSANAATVASFRCKKFLMDLTRKNKIEQTH